MTCSGFWVQICHGFHYLITVLLIPAIDAVMIALCVRLLGLMPSVCSAVAAHGDYCCELLFCRAGFVLSWAWGFGDRVQGVIWRQSLRGRSFSFAFGILKLGLVQAGKFESLGFKVEFGQFRAKGLGWWNQYFQRLKAVDALRSKTSENRGSRRGARCPLEPGERPLRNILTRLCYVCSHVRMYVSYVCLYV